MIDNARDGKEASKNTAKLTKFLDLSYSNKDSSKEDIYNYVKAKFPAGSQSALLLLPTHLLSSKPLYDLLEGFKTDSLFSSTREVTKTTPIKTEEDLHQYGYRVAGTVAEMVLELCCHHTTTTISSDQRDYLINSGGSMGIALQYVNIARDIATDAAMNRVYLPETWLQGESLEVEDILKMSTQKKANISALRTRLLNKAFELYLGARPAMEQLPLESRGPLRVAIESYMEIGRILQEHGPTAKLSKNSNKATVPVVRRLIVAWKAMSRSCTSIPVRQLESVFSNNSLANERISIQEKQPPKTAIVVGKSSKIVLKLHVLTFQ